MKAKHVGPATFATLGLLILSGAAWGLEFSMLKLATEGGYPEIGTLLAAMVAIAVVFWAAVALRGAWFRFRRDAVVFFLVVALLGYVLPLLAALWASSHVPAGLMTLIVSFTPVVTVAVVLLLRTEPVSPRRIAAVGLGLLAALIVLVPESEGPTGGALVWLLLVFVVPLTYGIESVYVSVAWPDGLDPLQVCAGQSLLAVLTLIPIQLVYGEPMPFDSSWPMAQLAIPVVAACILVEVLLYFVIIRQTGGVIVNFQMYIALFAGFAWGYAIFGEQHGLHVWIAVAVLVVGLALTIPRRGES